MRANDVRRRNIAAVVRALASRGPTPRSELAQLLCVSPGTVTRIAAELTAAGLVHELPAQPSVEVGRRRIPLRLHADRFAAVGVHVGLLHTTVGLVGLHGTLSGRPLQLPHRTADPGEVLADAASAVARLTARHPVRLLGTGISAPGAVEPGSTRFTSVDALGWREVDVVRLSGGRLPTPLLADVTHRARARAELRFGAARDTDSFVHLFVGNVVGAGLVLGGRRSEPPTPRTAGVAHLPLSRPALLPCGCGRPGCLTSVAGDRALAARAVREGFPDTDTVPYLAQAAAGSDRAADYLLRDRARAVGEAVAVLVDLLAPDRIFLAGSLLDVPAHLAEVRAEAVRRGCPAEDAGRIVVPSGLPRHSRVVAAATPVLEHFYEDPARALTDHRPTPGDRP